MAPKTQKLIICKGLPGSGKTTLAKKIYKEYNDSGSPVIMVAADDFFTHDDGSYNFDFRLINAAHQYCFGITFFWLSRGYTVIVHNTAIERWHVEPYIDFAHKMNYEWNIVEPTTKWRYDIAECAKRNTHGVSDATIQKMFDKWDSTKDLIKAFEKYV